MKRLLAVVFTVAVFGAVVTAADAHGPMGMGMGWGGGYHGGPMGGRMGAGPGACMGVNAGDNPAATEAVTEEKAKELATAYAAKYLKGYTVENVLPFEGRFATAYEVELKGPKGEKRILHVNPWGRVRPFGPLAATD